MERISVTKLANQIETEADAYIFLERLRWGLGRQVCPHCGCESANYIRPLNGVSRKTRTGHGSQRRVWQCVACRKQFSVLTGTVMHGTKISIRTWLFVIFEMCANKNGLAAREIERKYELTPKSAWFLTQRIREAMKRDPLAGMLKGVVRVDEAYIGGVAKNKHAWKREQEKPTGGGKKAIVLSLIEQHSGEVRSRVIPDVTGATLNKAISEQVNPSGSILQTDELTAYTEVGKQFVLHETVNHSEGVYARRNVTTNNVEGYFSQLKRSIDGTHHHVSTRHLPRYLAEFDFRYSTRKDSDTVRMGTLVDGMAGRRLTYRPLIGD
jgi:hypothetical protein